MSIRDDLLKTAQEIADSAQARTTALDAKLAGIEKEKLQIEAKRTALRDAFKRLANYPVANGADYLCPLCWVDEGKMSPFVSIPSETRDDIFRCRLCHFETVIPH